MQRIIKFRGQRIDNKEWISGFVIKGLGDTIHIMEECTYGEHLDCGDAYGRFYKVFPETIGQFTGIADNNKTDIFESDIMKWDSEDGEVTAIVIYKECDEENLHLSGFEFKIINVEEYNHDNPIEFTVIGNIHQNPELLK